MVLENPTVSPKQKLRLQLHQQLRVEPQRKEEFRSHIISITMATIMDLAPHHPIEQFTPSLHQLAMQAYSSYTLRMSQNMEVLWLIRSHRPTSLR